MPCGLLYLHEGAIHKTYFPNPKSKLPVLCKDGTFELIQWGRRENESGVLPLGGWAKKIQLEQGQWDRFFPTSVKIMGSEFLEIDPQTGAGSWYSITPGQYIHGVIMRDQKEFRCYLVTVEADKTFANQHWPQLLTDKSRSSIL